MRYFIFLFAWATLLPMKPCAQNGAYSEYVLVGKAQRIEDATKRFANETDGQGREIRWIAWDQQGNVTQAGERFFAVNGRVSEERIMSQQGTDTILYQYDFMLDGRLAHMLQGRKPEGRAEYHRYSYSSEGRTDSIFLGDTTLIRVERHRQDNGLPTKIQDFENNSTIIWSFDKRGNPTQETQISNGKQIHTQFKYHKNGQLASRMNDAELVQFAYDDKGRLLETTFLDEDSRVIERWVRVYE
jgi:YD repeat-containing protein